MHWHLGQHLLSLEYVLPFLSNCQVADRLIEIIFINLGCIILQLRLSENGPPMSISHLALLKSSTNFNPTFIHARLQVFACLWWCFSSPKFVSKRDHRMFGLKLLNHKILKNGSNSNCLPNFGIYWPLPKKYQKNETGKFKYILETRVICILYTYIHTYITLHYITLLHYIHT